MRPDWNLHYFRYVIGDGEPERHVGEAFDWFAISFWVDQPLVSTNDTHKKAVESGDYAYDVVAEVADVSQRACLIDFGLTAISYPDALAPGCRRGGFVTGKIYLEVPLSTGGDSPSYRWRVNRISADLTPYVPHPDYGHLVRDASQVHYQDAAGTDSVDAKSYILHCSVMSTQE